MNEPTDWTVVPLGITAEGETVVECPYCGRHAQLVDYHSIPFYNHRLGTFAVGNKLEFIDDSCPSR